MAFDVGMDNERELIRYRLNPREVGLLTVAVVTAVSLGVAGWYFRPAVVDVIAGSSPASAGSDERGETPTTPGGDVGESISVQSPAPVRTEGRPSHLQPSGGPTTPPTTTAAPAPTIPPTTTAPPAPTTTAPPPPQKMPDVVDMPPDAAVELLDALGVTVTTSDDHCPECAWTMEACGESWIPQVGSQSVEPGTVITPGMAVHLRTWIVKVCDPDWPGSSVDIIVEP